MRVRVLGSAAGGGFPQWNCACPGCRGVREGRGVSTARTQSQVALSRDGKSWHLLNASPDLRQQILCHADLQAGPESIRNSPLKSVTLTNADIDHTLGLLLLREKTPLRIFASAYVGACLREGNIYFKMLEQFEGHSTWTEIQPGVGFELEPGLKVTPVDMNGRPPYWAAQFREARGAAVMGLIIEDGSSRLGYFPGVGVVGADLLSTLGRCDAILFDGTFWDNDELARLHPGSRTALQMQHVPISGPEGSIAQLKALPQTTQKIFTHINNTNPILTEGSTEQVEVREAGWRIAYDGMELNLG